MKTQIKSIWYLNQSINKSISQHINASMNNYEHAWNKWENRKTQQGIRRYKEESNENKMPEKLNK